MLNRFSFLDSFKIFRFKFPMYLGTFRFGGVCSVPGGSSSFNFFPSKELLNLYWKNFCLVYNGFGYGFFSRITLKGVGFRCWSVGSNILFDVGFSHFIFCRVPVGVNIIARKNNLLLFSTDLALLNTVSSRIVSFRRPDVYKGKGLVWHGRIIRSKIRKRKVR